MREIALHILDIIQNSIAADAELVKLLIDEKIKKNELIIEIEDNGSGMSKKEQKEVVDPFVTSRKTREVGLGLPLLKANAENCSGNLEINSIPGRGTEVRVNFEYDHIDRAPLGDIVSTISTLITVNPDIDFIYRHRVNGDEFVFNTCDIKNELADIKINNPEVIAWIEKQLKDELKTIGGGEY